MVKDLSVNLCGLRLQNPVIPASGTFGFGLELADTLDLDVLGAISLKGTTREARYGNPVPRIAEASGGMLNAVGLQNPGIDVLVNEKIPALRKIYRQGVIANISGFSVEEYRECCAKADACEGIDIIEVNVSCPNVHGGGIAFGTSAKAAAEVTSAVKTVCHNKPVFINTIMCNKLTIGWNSIQFFVTIHTVIKCASIMNMPKENSICGRVEQFQIAISSFSTTRNKNKNDK